MYNSMMMYDVLRCSPQSDCDGGAAQFDVRDIRSKLQRPKMAYCNFIYVYIKYALYVHTPVSIVIIPNALNVMKRLRIRQALQWVAVTAAMRMKKIGPSADVERWRDGQHKILAE